LENANGSMDGKVILITGGTSGIGKAAATALARMGAEVVVNGRDREKGERALQEIRDKSGSVKVSLLLADLALQSEVRRLAEEFEASHERLDVLINNAGLILRRRTETPDGIETTLAINHLAPFLLTNLLLGLLKRSAPSRIITLTSEAERQGKMDLEDLQSKRRYGAFRIYGKTKLANIMFTYELADRLRETGVTANCVHPGSVNTEFGKNERGVVLLFRMFKPFMRSPEKGADTIVYLASSPEVEGMTGRYFSDREVVSSSEESYDRTLWKRLWEASEELTGLKAAAR
jgi:retinol dehydrogenase-14